MAGKSFAAQLVGYLIADYFDGDVGRFAAATQYTKQQVDGWRTGLRTPQRATLRWLLSATVAPEFKVASEFSPVEFSTKGEISKKLKNALNGHESACGVYSFYDSMCNVIYVGKASSGFLGEMYQQLRAPLGVKFAKAIRKAPSERWQVVKYISAYEIPDVEHLDYPKHVESLVLRLSKPIGNKILGNLKSSSAPKEKS
jgi:hypothetical protein